MSNFHKEIHTHHGSGISVCLRGCTDSVDGVYQDMLMLTAVVKDGEARVLLDLNAVRKLKNALERYEKQVAR